MKIAVIGGAGVRTPLLVSGLTHADLPIETIALYDVDGDRLPVIRQLASDMAGGSVRVTAGWCCSGTSGIWICCGRTRLSVTCCCAALRVLSA